MVFPSAFFVQWVEPLVLVLASTLTEAIYTDPTSKIDSRHIFLDKSGRVYQAQN